MSAFAAGFKAAPKAGRMSEPPPDPLDASWQAQVRRGEGGAPWVPDSASISCMTCTQRFGLLRRRHHCRRCGALVCGDCSTGRVGKHILKGDAQVARLASALGESNLRLCKKCITVIDYRIMKSLKDRGFKRPAVTVTRSGLTAGATTPVPSASNADTSSAGGSTASGSPNPASAGLSPTAAIAADDGGAYTSFSSMMDGVSEPTPSKPPANPLRAPPESKPPPEPAVDPEEEAKEARRKKFP